MILCCGEALIDFFPIESAAGDLAFQPFNGGSIYNVAIALGRLEQSVGFFGGLSNDFFGEMLVKELSNSSVDISLCAPSDLATTLAFVNFATGQPSYVFLDENSAGRMLNTAQIPELPNDVSALHFGSISLIHDPAATVFEQLADREKDKSLISIDPNIRPSLIVDETAYRARLERMLALADIIKISDEDLEWLQPGSTQEGFAQQMLKRNARLVVVTKGKNGATGYSKRHKINQPIEKIDQIDTVGAGDTFMAGLLASLENQHILTGDKLVYIDQNSLADALLYASRAAAITVSRKGANPPWKEELHQPE